jgi:murein DD-endopeptidase MepM/ murein hydrolase activator NlpD
MIACLVLAACTPAPKYRSHPLREEGTLLESVHRDDSIPALGIKLEPPVHNFTASRVTSPFGTAAEPGARGRRHDGIDIKAASAEPVYAAAAGSIVFAGRQRGYGNVVIIDHGDSLTTVYAHLFYACVRKGDRVVKGETIGRAGKRGRATGTHLHFEVRRGGGPLDPAPYLWLDSGSR